MKEKKVEWDCDDEILIKGMVLKNDETNNRTEQGFDRAENKNGQTNINTESITDEDQRCHYNDIFLSVKTGS